MSGQDPLDGAVPLGDEVEPVGVAQPQLFQTAHQRKKLACDGARMGHVSLHQALEGLEGAASRSRK